MGPAGNFQTSIHICYLWPQKFYAHFSSTSWNFLRLRNALKSEPFDAIDARLFFYSSVFLPLYRFVPVPFIFQDRLFDKHKRLTNRKIKPSSIHLLNLTIGSNFGIHFKTPPCNRWRLHSMSETMSKKCTVATFDVDTGATYRWNELSEVLSENVSTEFFIYSSKKTKKFRNNFFEWELFRTHYLTMMCQWYHVGPVVETWWAWGQFHQCSHSCKMLAKLSFTSIKIFISNWWAIVFTCVSGSAHL